MADAVWIEFGPAVTAKVYDQINDRVNPPGNPPDGLVLHCAGPSPDGGWRIVDVWDSRDSFDRFFEEKVGPVVAELFGPEAAGEPPTIVSWPIHNTTLVA